MPQTIVWREQTCFNHVTIQRKTNFSVKQNWMTLLCTTVYENSRDENTNVQVLRKSLHVWKTNSEHYVCQFNERQSNNARTILKMVGMNLCPIRQSCHQEAANRCFLMNQHTWSPMKWWKNLEMPLCFILLIHSIVISEKKNIFTSFYSIIGLKSDLTRFLHFSLLAWPTVPN